MIYVASSWRNPRYESVLDCLEQWALPYYNWRDEEGFHWSDVFNDLFGLVSDRPQTVDHWTEPIPAPKYMAAMAHERARAGFERDMKHLQEATAVILLLECGKSAHLEAGWAAGAGKPTALYMTGPLQPELMYGMLELITDDIDQLMRWARSAYVGSQYPREARMVQSSGTVAIAQEDIKAGQSAVIDLSTGKLTVARG